MDAHAKQIEMKNHATCNSGGHCDNATVCATIANSVSIAVC